MDFESLTDIQRFYKGSTIFVTGGTGFLGHLLLAKLLRSCPGIKTIYVLVREKKSVPAEKRFQELFPEPVEEKVKNICPNYKDVVKLMAGDCMKPNLALSEENIAILKNEVNVVFHVAATINFTAPLQEAALLNVACTSELLSIATEMKNLKAFLHVSTVFTNYVGRDVLEERFYDMPIDPDKLVTLIRQLDTKTISEIQPKLLGPFPNTYVFTKTLAEGVCQQYWSTLPVVLFRPAIVLNCYKDPIPGWINAIHGPVGIFAAMSVGMVKTVHVDGSTYTNIVPCDYVINGMIASAYAGSNSWISSKNGLDDPKPDDRIYNFGSSGIQHVINWHNLIKTYCDVSNDYPSTKSIRLASCSTVVDVFVYKLMQFLYHFLPAIILDNTNKLFGKDLRMRRQYQRLDKLSDILSKFLLKNWIVKNTNTEKVWAKLTAQDKEIYPFDLNSFDWNDYIKVFVLGVRHYMLYDTIENLPAAKKKQIRLTTINQVIQLIITLGITYTLYVLVKTIAF